MARGREEVHVDPRDPPIAELDVARAGAVEARRLLGAADPGDQLIGHDAGGALGEHPRLRRADARDVAHRVHAREPGGEGVGIDGDPPVFRHACVDDHGRSPVHRDPQEQVARKARAVVEDRVARVRVQRRHPVAGDELDAALAERSEERLRGRRRRRDRGAERDDHLDPDVVADAALAQVLVEQDRGLARCRWALERGAADADDRRSRRERGEPAAEGLGAGDRVELVAGLGQTGRGREVVVGPQGHHDDVGFVGVEVGHDAPSLRVDRGDRLLPEPDPRVGDLLVRDADGLRFPLPEQHVELREAEHERVGAIDQGDLDLVAELLREPTREFETAEACTEDEHRGRHGARIGQGFVRRPAASLPRCDRVERRCASLPRSTWSPASR